MRKSSATITSWRIIFSIIFLATTGLALWRIVYGPTELECKIQGKILSTRMDGSAKSFCAEKDYGGLDKVY